MSLTDNARNVAFATPYNIDKIVKVFTGSYDASGTTARVGNLATAYVFTIPHSLNRPVFCEMLWSTDGGVTYTDGGTLNASGENKLAFSDSTNVYIFHGYSQTGTVFYKIYCSWIDDYDSTNPSVEVTQYNDAPVQFDSRLNYQKIANQDVLKFNGGTGGTTEIKSVTHSLGYNPNAKVWFEAFTGEVWPLNAGGASNFFDYDTAQDECSLSISTTAIDVTMYEYSGIERRAWYKIYYDAT